MNAHAHDIWSEEVGPVDAPLVVLIHGSMDRSSGMLKLSRHLDARARVLRYDRRGYGRSAPHDGPFAIDEQVAIESDSPLALVLLDATARDLIAVQVRRGMTVRDGRAA